MSQMPQKKIVLKRGHQCWRHLRLYYFAETYLNGFLPTVVVIVFQLMFRTYLQDDQQLRISWVMSNNRCYHIGIQIHDFLAFVDHKHQEICSLLPVRKIKSNAVNTFHQFFHNMTSDNLFLRLYIFMKSKKKEAQGNFQLVLHSSKIAQYYFFLFVLSQFLLKMQPTKYK